MTEKDETSGAEANRVFAFFNEIGIINQLSTALLAQCLPDGVHPSHFAVLNHLYRVGNGTTSVRIAAAMQVTKTTMSHTTKVLEDRGFIQISPDPEDGRAKLVFLTEAGRAFRNQAIQSVTHRFGHIIEPKHSEMMGDMMLNLQEIRKLLDSNR